MAGLHEIQLALYVFQESVSSSSCSFIEFVITVPVIRKKCNSATIRNSSFENNSGKLSTWNTRRTKDRNRRRLKANHACL